MHEQLGPPKLTICIAKALVLAAFPATSIAQIPPPEGYAVRRVGLTGSAYEFPDFGTVYHITDIGFLNASGQAAGVTQRRSGPQFNGITLGQDAWVWTGAATQQVGLTGIGYETLNYGGTSGSYRSTEVLRFNESGHAAGRSQRRTGSTGTGTVLGYDAWIWDGNGTQQLGYVGDGYEVPNFSGSGLSQRVSQVSHINVAGQVAGYSDRYLSSGTSLGRDAWLWTGGTHQRLGLTGGVYELSNYFSSGGTFRSSEITQLSANGVAAGFTVRRTGSGSSGGTNVGQDAWIWTGSNQHQVGLTGAGYEWTNYQGSGAIARESRVNLLHAAGHIAGVSRRATGTGFTGSFLGQDAWVRVGSTTHVVGLTGGPYDRTSVGQTTRSSEVTRLNASGQAAGVSTRFSSGSTTVGRDPWVWNGITTVQVGLTGSDYETTNFAGSGATYRFGTVTQFNDAGQAAGSTSRRNSNGQDAWVWTGTETKQVGLLGLGYESAGSGTAYRFSEVVRLNALGQAVGNSERPGLGQDAWFFDDEVSTTIALRFSQASNGYSYASAKALTDEGVVLGSYRLFSGSSDLGLRAFWWSAGAGFYDLGTLVGELDAAGWQYLSDVAFSDGPTGASAVPGGSPTYIVGYGHVAGQSTGQSAFVLTALVPEPGSFTFTVAGVAALLLRRRRCVHL